MQGRAIIQIESERKVTKSKIIRKFQEARVQRILETPATGLITKPWVRRALAVLAVFASNVYLAAILVPDNAFYSLAEQNKTQVVTFFAVKYLVLQLAPVVMLASFFALRKSMEYVTSVPDEYLDERQIENRDWAFRNGYLVVRRSAFAIALVGAAINFIFWVTTPRTGAWPPPEAPLADLEKMFNAYLASLTTSGASVFYVSVLILLTYVAYSFPTILLAWREAKFSEPTSVGKPNRISETPIFAKAYARRISIVLLGLALTIASGFIPYAFWNGLVFYVLFTVVAYGMFVFIWASIKSFEILRQVKKRSPDSVMATVFFFITQLFGLSILVIFYLVTQYGIGNGINPYLNPLFYIIGLGILMIPSQAISIRYIKRISE